MEELGAKTIIYTDISRDGMLAGPNLKAMEEMVKAVNIEVIASGGVRNIDDIRNLKTWAFPALLSEGIVYRDLDLKEAIEVAK